jgi:type IX secretion system PorP/SprF family membrane protein
MNKLISKIILTLIALISGMSSNAQDPHFSQYYANPLYLNPAMAGSALTPRLTLNYRNQWPSLDANFVTYGASYDQYLPDINSGVGIQLLTDRAGQGILVSGGVSAFYSYRLMLNKDMFVNFGAKASFFQGRLDWDKLTFGDQYDPVQGLIFETSEIRPSQTSKSIVDFSIGGVYTYQDIFFGGIAVDHLTQPANGFYDDKLSKLYMKVTLHGGAVLDLRSKKYRGARYNKITLSPNIIYQQQQNFRQINFGVYLNRNPFVLGLWYRNSIQNADAIIALLGFQYNNLKFGYSYDITISRLQNATGGAHEISFGYTFDSGSQFRSRRTRLEAIPSPSF